jgi:8-oxo-dGTP pyrophosphatase MutT (NUDIX family)
MKRFVEDFRTRIFSIEHADVEGTPFYRLVCPDWVNVIPLTPDHRVAFVRQFRHGVGADTLEVPGGQMDPGDATPLQAARRELLEESGFAGETWELLGWVHPNPAILVNRCHSFLVRDARPVSPIRNDHDERTEVELVPLEEVPRLILDGTITHALVLNAFHFLQLRGNI